MEIASPEKERNSSLKATWIATAFGEFACGATMAILAITSDDQLVTLTASASAVGSFVLCGAATYASLKKI